MQVGALLELPLPRVADLRLAEACTSFLVAAPGGSLEPAAMTGTLTFAGPLVA